MYQHFNTPVKKCTLTVSRHAAMLSKVELHYLQIHLSHNFPSNYAWRETITFWSATHGSSHMRCSWLCIHHVCMFKGVLYYKWLEDFGTATDCSLRFNIYPVIRMLTVFTTLLLTIYSHDPDTRTIMHDTRTIKQDTRTIINIMNFHDIERKR